MTALRFVEVHIPGASPERHELVGPRALIGTGARATVRLAQSSGFAELEVEIRPNLEGALVSSVGDSASRIVFGGATAQTVQVPWGEEVFVNGVRLTFLAGATRRTGPNPLLLIVAPLVLVVAGFATLQSLQASESATREVDAPSLVDEDRPCGESSPQAAEHDARSAEQAALAKEERFPFDAKDGVEAARLLGEARACFGAAGLEADRVRVDAESRQWSERLNEDYAGLRLRLKVALDNQRLQDALETVRALEALLAPRPDSPYRQWLASMHRELEAKTARSRG